jgi:ATP-dependent helicase/nuclease subunit A
MDTSDAGGDDLGSVDIIQRSQLDAISTEVMRKRQSRLERTPAAKSAAVSKKALNLLGEIRNSIRWEYPHADVTKIAAKQSVSELTHHDDEFAALDPSGTFQRLPKAWSAGQTDKEAKADARTVGTATHLLIQHIDLSADITTASIRATAQQLVENGRLPTATAAVIDIEPIAGFFQSDLGRIVCRHKDALLREWPFTLAVDAGSTGESIVVQGIVDMIVPTPEGLVVIDFKTDNINADAVDRRKELYADQIRYYARAAGAILRQNVLSAWLYFLKPGRPAQVEVE